MGIMVDFTGVEATQGAGPVAEGEYRCIIDKAEQTTSQQGTPGIEVALRITGGDFDGRFLWDRIWFTEKAMGMARWKIECAGLPIPAGAFNLEPANLVGRAVMITVRHEDYQGKTQAKVKGWESAGASNGPAVADDGSEIPF